MRIVAKAIGDLKKDMERQIKVLDRAIVEGLGQAAKDLKLDIRSQISAAGLGRRLGNTIRDKVYPNNGVRPAAFIYSQSPDIVRAFDQGITIRARNSTWLAIPTKNVPRFWGKYRTTPKRLLQNPFYKKNLRFVPVDSETALLVIPRGIQKKRKNRSLNKSARREVRDTVLFVLKKQVKINKRLNIFPLADKHVERIPSLIDRAWAAKAQQ